MMLSDQLAEGLLDVVGACTALYPKRLVIVGEFHLYLRTRDLGLSLIPADDPSFEIYQASSIWVKKDARP